MSNNKTQTTMSLLPMLVLLLVWSFAIQDSIITTLAFAPNAVVVALQSKQHKPTTIGSSSSASPSSFSFVGKSSSRPLFQRSAATGRNKSVLPTMMMMMDPHNLVHHAQSTTAGLFDLFRSHDNNDSLLLTTSQQQMDRLATLLSTTYTATAGAAKHSSSPEWSFLWFHGGTSDPYDNGHSLLPVSIQIPAPESIARDYFLPTDTEEAMNAAIAAQKQAIANAPDGIPIHRDGITIQSAFPGAMGKSSHDGTAVNKDINAHELERMAREMDFISWRLPLAAIFFALVDFFFIGGGRDIYGDELVDDGDRVRADWIVDSGIRVGLVIVLTWITIFFSNITYHPLG